MEQQRTKKTAKWNIKQSKVTLIMILGLVGILLIGISPMLKRNDGTEKNKSYTESYPSAEEYAAALETRLKDILGKIDGVGEVEVMITLKSGYTYTYAVTEKVDSDVSEEYKSEDQRKTQQKSTTEQNYVMVEGSSSAQPLVTALNEPEIKGVVVVCTGGGDAKVVAQVTNAVRTALDISSAKITVSKISSRTGADN